MSIDCTIEISNFLTQSVYIKQKKYVSAYIDVCNSLVNLLNSFILVNYASLVRLILTQDYTPIIVYYNSFHLRAP